MQPGIDAEVAQAAFSVACFLGLSDIHECTGRLQMAVYPLGKQTAGCNSPHDCTTERGLRGHVQNALQPEKSNLCADYWAWLSRLHISLKYGE